MYVTAQRRKSVRDEEFRAFLRGAGYSDDQIDAVGPRVTERIKQLAKAEYDAGGLSTTISVPAQPVRPLRRARPQPPVAPEAVAPEAMEEEDDRTGSEAEDVAVGVESRGAVDVGETETREGVETEREILP